MRRGRRFYLIMLVPSFVVIGQSCVGLSPCRAEPNRQDCDAAVAQARALAAALPADNLSRYFAERDLQQAMVEAGNGEFDECLDMAARAAEEVKQRRHELPPGETLKVLKPDE
jgi:hypothetical protein